MVQGCQHFLFPILLLTAFHFYFETAGRDFSRFPMVLAICVTFIGMSVHISERICAIFARLPLTLCHFRNVFIRSSVMRNDFVSQCGKAGFLSADGEKDSIRGNRFRADLGDVLRLAVAEFLADGEAGFLHIGLDCLDALVVHILRGGRYADGGDNLVVHVADRRGNAADMIFVLVEI